MPKTTPLIKAALNLTAGAGFDVYKRKNGHQELNLFKHPMEITKV